MSVAYSHCTQCAQNGPLAVLRPRSTHVSRTKLFKHTPLLLGKAYTLNNILQWNNLQLYSTIISSLWTMVSAPWLYNEQINSKTTVPKKSVKCRRDFAWDITRSLRRDFANNIILWDKNSKVIRDEKPHLSTTRKCHGHSNTAAMVTCCTTFCCRLWYYTADTTPLVETLADLYYRLYGLLYDTYCIVWFIRIWFVPYVYT